MTPPFGTLIAGYFEERPMDGVLDPLYASVIAFDDGETKALLFALDHIGIRLSFASEVREAISKATGLPYEAISLTCSHTHLGPEASRKNGVLENEEYNLWFQKRLCDAALMALEDVAPTEMLVCRGRVEDVAFVRRFRMKDGSVQTNPGCMNPNIDHVLGDTDEESQLLILKREGKPEIGIVTFQVHPDVIGGCKVSADYIKFVRDTYEKNIPNSYCVYLNGAQGDTNHIDVRLDPNSDDLIYGYRRAKYMGEKIAYSVLSNYEVAKPISGGKVRFKEVSMMARYNKGNPDQLEDAIRRSAIYQAEGLDAATPEFTGMRKIEVVSEAERIVRVKDFPDAVSLPLVAIAAGGAVFSTVPGEPFTDVGVQIKAGSKFDFTIATCCSNGDEAYFPTQAAFDEGGYEVVSTDFAEGTAEQIVRDTLALINSL